MDIWFGVYILTVCVASATAYRGGYRINDWEYWAIVGSVMVSRLSGLVGEG